MIVKRSNLAGVFKLHYLRTALRGEAAALLNELPAAGENFESGWKTVKDYYNNSRLLITKLLSKFFFSTKAMESESAQEISRLRTSTNNLLQALKVLGSPIDQWGHITVFITTSRLTPSIQRKWEEAVAKSDDPQTVPLYSELDKFMEIERLALVQLESARGLESSQTINSKNSSNKSQPSKNKWSSATHLEHEDKPKPQSSCVYCQGSHFIANCNTFRSKTPLERKRIAANNRLCFNCLNGHMASNCKSSRRCHCSGKHHPLLHFKVENRDNSRGPTQTSMVQDQESKPLELNNKLEDESMNGHVSVETPSILSATGNQPVIKDTVLLATAWIYVQASKNVKSLARAMVDQGAQSSFITEKLCQSLRLKRRPVRVPITGVGDNKEIMCKSRVEFIIKPHFSSNFSCTVNAFVIPRITTYEPFTGKAAEWRHLEGLDLADPKYGQPGGIEILLGAEVHAQIMEEGLRKDDSVKSPIAMKTLLGWIISGPTSINSMTALRINVNLQTQEIELNTLLRQFWEIEEVPRDKLLTDEEKQCEKFYNDTVSRKEDGRYVVRLPFKTKIPTSAELGDSYSTAVQMMYNLERRFSKNSELKSLYVEGMRGYLVTGHMRPALDENFDVDECFFLPHHGVLKESSTTTRLRTVFNASRKTSKGISLNDLLLTGPNLLPELPDLISCWRCFPFVFVADAEKMFRQIWVHPEDQRFQAVVWRENNSDELLKYFLTTVTFGFNCAPYLASKTLKQLASDEGSTYPLGREVLEEAVYMDDVLSGDFTLDRAKLRQVEVIDLLNKGGFKLRKWLSNSNKLLDWLPKDLIASENALEMNLGFSVLGISWAPLEDYFQFKISLEPMVGFITKRTVLAKIAKMFDPLGWIAPIVVTSKIFMQSLWVISKEWDTELPQDKIEFWLDWYASWSDISKLKVPRWLGMQARSQTFEIHGFADASKEAYAAVVYLRVIADNSRVSLLGAKTKVSPVKTKRIPQLELCAAHLLSKLVQHFLQTLKLTEVTTHLWSDSYNVLYWLREVPCKWPTFIANRCSDILTWVPNAYWHYIESGDNPADVASRGSSVIDLVNDKLWWQGPQRLRESSLPWKRVSEFSKTPKDDLVALHAELETSVMVAVRPHRECQLFNLIEKYSSLPKLVRVTVYILRFVRKLVDKVSFRNKISEVLCQFPYPSVREIQGKEIRQAKLFWSYITQLEYFGKEIELLKGEGLPRSHQWVSLNPSLMGGLIRVGGRLKHSLLQEDEKHPVILPRESLWARLLIEYFHHLTLHGGVQLTLTCLRSMFWIVKGKMAVKIFIQKCVTCARRKGIKTIPVNGRIAYD